MLQADKQVLLAGVKRNALELRQRELEFHVERYTNLATQASVVAGFAFESLVELELPEGTHPLLASCYFTSGSLAMALALYVLCVASFACVFGHRLALQGPHGSLERSVHILIEHRMHIFSTAAASLMCLVASAVLMAWIKMGPAASVISAIFFTFAVSVYRRMQYMFDIFHIPEDKLVTGATRVQDANANGAVVDLSHLNPASRTTVGVSASAGAYSRLAEEAPTGGSRIPSSLLASCGGASAAFSMRSSRSAPASPSAVATPDMGSAASMAVRQQGHLFKRGDRNSYFGTDRFSRRYFVLQGSALFYFKEWENYGADGVLAATNSASPIDVRRYDAVMLRDDQSEQPNRFDLVPTVNPLERKYELQGATRDEVEDWIRALHAAKGMPLGTAGQATVLVHDS